MFESTVSEDHPVVGDAEGTGGARPVVLAGTNDRVGAGQRKRRDDCVFELRDNEDHVASCQCRTLAGRAAQTQHSGCWHGESLPVPCASL